jgi:hypothetical protein
MGLINVLAMVNSQNGTEQCIDHDSTNTMGLSNVISHGNLHTMGLNNVLTMVILIQ